MHPSFLPNLVDPKTGEPLRVECRAAENGRVLEGLLISPSNSYPIVRGVPRFAGYQQQAYTRSFSYQWTKWSKVQFESENVGTTMAGHTKTMWEKITGVTADDLKGQLIADFGCGAGRFIEVVRMKKGRVIGLDLSDSVDSAAAHFRHDPDVLVCQADILNPPIRQASVDGAFSIGVLHHTPDPVRGFQQLARVIKPGGWAAVAVYGKGGYYDFPTISLYRSLFRALWPIFRHYPPLLYSYFATFIVRPLCRGFIGKAVRTILPFRDLPDSRWALLDTFDSVTPSYQSAHESYEVFQWFKKTGFDHAEPSDWGFTAYHGIRAK